MDDVIQLRAWPPTTLPVPEVRVGVGRWELESDGILAWREADFDERYYTLPDEFWMRELLTLNLEDPESIALFCTQYGMLDLPLLLGRKVSIVGLSDYRHAASRMRNVARYLLAQAGYDRRWITDREEDALGLDIQSSGWERWVLAHIGRALSPLHPRLIHPKTTGPELGGYDGSLSAVDLTTGIALQMFNFVVDQPHVSLCEWCGHEFIYQRGRSKYGQHRSTSVRYCTPEHAQDASRKAYRDRQRQKRAKGGETNG